MEPRGERGYIEMRAVQKEENEKLRADPSGSALRCLISEFVVYSIKYVIHLEVTT